MLIRKHTINIEISTHSVQEFEYEAIAHLDADITPVLPYLNATLSRGVYLPDKPALSWRHEGRNMGFWPRRIAVDHLASREDVETVVQSLIDLVNEIWGKRDQIEPDHTTHKLLQPLELHRLLPKTNCKLCGESTCFNFALKIVAGQAKITGCIPLYQDPAWDQRREKLEKLVDTKWPAIG